jgi:MFS family permease
MVYPGQLSRCCVIELIKQASWLGTAYLLGLAGMTPLYGRLAQVMGRKGAMLLALSLFLGE